MGIKLLLVLVIIGIQVSDGGKIVKKLTKELKKVIKGFKFDEFIAHTIEVVEGNIINIASNSENVANNSDIIHHSSDKIHRVADHLDNLKNDVAVNAASIKKNTMDIAHHHPSEWLMVATGNVGSMANPSNVVETINMEDSTASCKSLPLYPHDIRKANGMTINGEQIIAGGTIEGSGQISEVYKLDYLANSWVLLGNMAEKRNQFAVAELNGGVWAIGGFTGGISLSKAESWSSMQSSTEIIYTDGTILDGPDLPQTRARHCAVTLPNGKVVIMGGRTSQSVLSKDVLIYDPSTSTYTSGPQMAYGHENFACVHFYSDKHGGRPVILSAGGISQSKAEIYDYVNGIWEQIPDIPSPYSPSKDGPRAVPSLDGKGAFLQNGENFFELTCDTSSCTWSVMDQTLDVGRKGVVMMYLPSVFECDRGCEDNSHVSGLLEISAPEDIVEWETTCTHGNIYGDSVSSCPNWHTFTSGSSFCHIKTTLNGSGRAKIDFGNCFNDGVSKLFLNGNEIASAGASENIIKEFDFTDGSELKLTEEQSGVISFNSFEVLTC